MFRSRPILTIMIVVIVALTTAMFVLGQGSMLWDLVVGLGAVDPTLLACGLACSVSSILNRGVLNRYAHRAVGLETGVGEMTSTAAVGFAAEKMIKSAGAVGLAVFIRRGRRRGHDAASVAAACVLTAIASFVAFGVLLAVTIAVLGSTGRLTGWWIAAAVGFSIYTAVVTLAVWAVLRSDRAAAWLWQKSHVVRRRLRRRSRSAAAVEDQPFPAMLLEALATARRRPGLMGRMLFHAVGSKILGAAMLAIAVMAVGLPLDLPTALVIYATALAASMASIVPGGVGTVEGSTAALLVAAGATAGASALAVALFRLFDLLVPVAVGAYAARRELVVAEPITASHDAVELAASPRALTAVPMMAAPAI